MIIEILQQQNVETASENVVIPAFEKDFSEYTVTEFSSFAILILLIVFVIFSICKKRK